MIITDHLKVRKNNFQDQGKVKGSFILIVREIYIFEWSQGKVKFQLKLYEMLYLVMALFMISLCISNFKLVCEWHHVFYFSSIFIVSSRFKDYLLHFMVREDVRSVEYSVIKLIDNKAKDDFTINLCTLYVTYWRHKFLGGEDACEMSLKTINRTCFLNCWFIWSRKIDDIS